MEFWDEAFFVSVADRLERFPDGRDGKDVSRSQAAADGLSATDPAVSLTAGEIQDRQQLILRILHFDFRILFLKKRLPSLRTILQRHSNRIDNRKDVGRTGSVRALSR